MPEQVKLNCGVVSLRYEDGMYRVELSDGSSIAADHVVLATPAFVTADIVRRIDPWLAERLRAIRYASTATVSLGFRQEDLAKPLKGYGFIVPAAEHRLINACSWSSRKFSHRAPDDCVLMRAFVGGALAEEYAELDEESLIALARKELKEIAGIDATPVLAKAYRWMKASPQYEVGHGELVKKIEELVSWHPGLHVTGAAYRGAGIPDCVEQGLATALKIVAADARGCCGFEEAKFETVTA